MKTVEKYDEILQNIKTLDQYLESSDNGEYARGLIKRGTCFVVIQAEEGSYHFYPSRFIGYVNNNRQIHANNDSKDGRVTNKAISTIFNNKNPLPTQELESKYCDFCNKLGFTANSTGSFGVQRKFWI